MIQTVYGIFQIFYDVSVFIFSPFFKIFCFLLHSWFYGTFYGIFWTLFVSFALDRGLVAFELVA